MKKSIFILFVLITGNLSAQIPNSISKSEKIYGLSKFWQEVNYNFIYLDKVDKEKWERDYKKLLIKVQETKNDYEYYRLLQKFCASLGDGHTNIYFPDSVQNQIYNTYFGDYRLFLTNIDGKAIVTRTNLSKKLEIPIGTEIIKVNGVPTAAYIDKYVKPYIASSTPYILEDWSVSGLLRAPKGTSFDIEFKLTDGSIKQLQLTHAETTEKEVYPEFDNRELLDFKWLKDKTAYISLNSFDDVKIDSLFIEALPELYKAKKLIIDLRHNGGGDTGIGRAIFEYLTNDNLLYGSKSVTRKHVAAYKAWGMFLTPKDTINGKSEWGLTKENTVEYYRMANNEGIKNFEYAADTVKLKGRRIVIPTVILIGHRTASAAEDFLIYAANQKHIILIGTPTFGSTGQPLSFDLPGGGSARVCTKKDTYPDGKEFVGVGIQPDIEVKKTWEDYIKKTDTVLEKAIEYLDKI